MKTIILPGIITVVLLLALLISISLITIGKSGESTSPDGSPLLGNPSAPISVIVYSDFQCPFCKDVQGTMTSLKESKMVREGTVHIVFKHLPLTGIHPFAQKAAEAAECANLQEQFWQYHDLLFAHQDALDVSSLKTYAEQLDLDMDTFVHCLDSGAAAKKIEQDRAEGLAAGAKGTPFFVINKQNTTRQVAGAVAYETLVKAIREP